MARYPWVAPIFGIALLQHASHANDAIRDIQILSRNIAANTRCRELKTFKKADVRAFFENASSIAPEQLSNYKQLDCRISGSLKMGSSEFLFEIQPIWIGSLKNKASGKIQRYGCGSCDSLFPTIHDSWN